jgi:hypothetical protein
MTTRAGPQVTPRDGPSITPSIVIPSPATTPGAYVLPTRSPTFDFVPRTIGRAEDEDLITPLITVPYDATMFGVWGTGTLTVTPAQFYYCAYQRLGHVVVFSIEVNCSVTGTPSQLTVRLPIGPAVQFGSGPAYYGGNNTMMVFTQAANSIPDGWVYSRYANCLPFSGGTFAAGSVSDIQFTLIYFI